jgi:hypothetical protein
MSGRRRRTAEHSEDWQALLPHFDWPEQQAYEELRPLVLFGLEEALGATSTLPGDPDKRRPCKKYCFLSLALYHSAAMPRAWTMPRITNSTSQTRVRLRASG